MAGDRPELLCHVRVFRHRTVLRVVSTFTQLFLSGAARVGHRIFDQDGRFLAAWTQFGQPGGLFIDRHDVLYVSDSLSGKERHPGWTRGIRIGSARDGAVTAFIPDPTPEADPITAPEAVAADVDGTVYGAVVPARRLLRYARTEVARP